MLRPGFISSTRYRGDCSAPTVYAQLAAQWHTGTRTRPCRARVGRCLRPPRGGARASRCGKLCAMHLHHDVAAGVVEGAANGRSARSERGGSISTDTVDARHQAHDACADGAGPAAPHSPPTRHCEARKRRAAIHSIRGLKLLARQGIWLAVLCMLHGTPPSLQHAPSPLPCAHAFLLRLHFRVRC